MCCVGIDGAQLYDHQTLCSGSLVPRLFKRGTLKSWVARGDEASVVANHNNYPVNCFQIFRDWQLILLTLTVAGIALTLLLFGAAIPQLRGNITMARDLEFPDGVAVSTLTSVSTLSLR